MNEAHLEPAEEIRLDHYLAAVWRAKWLILAGAIAAAAVTLLLARNQPAVYNATLNIEIGRVWKEPLEDYYLTAETINSPGFMSEVAAESGIKPNVLKRGVKAEAIEGGPRRARYPILVRITATADSADAAAEMARAVAGEVIARHEKLFNDSLAERTNRARAIEQRLEQLRAAPSPASLQAVAKMESELAEIKASNSSPTVTRKSRVIEEQPVSSAAARPSAWRGAAASAIIAALALAAASALASHLRPARRGLAASNQG